MSTMAVVDCPYCGERIALAVDASAGAYDAIEDCTVCCRPIALAVEVDVAGDITVSARAEDEGWRGNA